MMLRRCQPSESRDLRRWIMERHYTRSAPPGYRIALEFLEGRERVGGMLLGRPTARSLDAQRWLELTRMYFVDEAPKNTESRALGMMWRFVWTWLPEVRGLLSYSDPSAGHAGTVYAADGWAAFGKTNSRSKPWRNRPGRAETHSGASKVRWVRTP